MLTSSILKQNDQLLSVLADSKKLTKILEEIKKADKAAKESMKALSQGKSYKSALEAMKLEAEEYSKDVVKAKKYLKDYKLKAIALVEEARNEAEVVLSEASKVKTESQDKLTAIEIALKNAKECEESTTKALAQAAMKEAKTSDLKKQYEDKLKDIKKRLEGL